MADSNVKNRPYISVIVPCYNSEAYLDRSIKSIIGQTFDSWELIAVNDGSTDKTPAILNGYAETDKRIRVFSKENGGYCSAVNFGLGSVKGEYFMFMGSDDSLETDLFAKLYEKINALSPDIVGFRTNKIKNGENIGIDGYTDFDTPVYEGNTSIRDFQKNHPVHAKIINIRDTSKIFKSSLLGDLRYFGRYGFDADGIFSMLFADKCRSFMCVPIDGYNWTLRGDSLSGKQLTLDVYEDRLDNWMKFYKALAGYKKGRSLLSDSEEYCVDYYYDVAWKYAGMLKPHDKKLSFLKKHTRFIFLTMRRYRISVGKTRKENILNYLRLLFPTSALKK